MWHARVRTRLVHRLAGFFPAVLNAAETERHPQNPFRQLPNRASRHAVNHGQLSNRARSTAARNDLAHHGQFPLRRSAAFRAYHALTLVLGDVRFGRRQPRHLMPSRMTLRGQLSLQICDLLIALVQFPSRSSFSRLRRSFSAPGAPASQAPFCEDRDVMPQTHPLPSFLTNIQVQMQDLQGFVRLTLQDLNCYSQEVPCTPEKCRPRTIAFGVGINTCLTYSEED